MGLVRGRLIRSEFQDFFGVFAMKSMLFWRAHEGSEMWICTVLLPKTLLTYDKSSVSGQDTFEKVADSFRVQHRFSPANVFMHQLH